MEDFIQKDYLKHSLSLKRTLLSINQTKMAARRTLLSYISTGSVFISLALAYIKLLENTVDFVSLIMFGVALIFLVICIVDFIMVQKSFKELLEQIQLEEKEDEKHLKK